jgi:hypothetical protein
MQQSFFGYFSLQHFIMLLPAIPTALSKESCKKRLKAEF